ncbi:unnamed protein product [Ectocarpus sp. CCAP 1310/34]|nr:unnamed protein product [Ectocarpus sp. CCAP 1310/34]
MSSSQWEALPQRARKRRPATAASATPAVGNPPPQPPPPDQQRQREEKVASAAPPAPPKLASVTRASPASGAAAATAAATGAAGLVPVVGVAEGGHGNQQPRRTSSGGPKESGGRDQHDPCRGNASSLVSVGDNACSLAKPTGAATPVDGGVVRDDGRGREDDRVVEGRGSAEDTGGKGGDKAAAVAARHAAVTAEVDARSKIKRFSGGLEGGAGADGGAEGANFEWGDSIERAMEGALAAMFNTITDIARVDINPALTREMEIEGELWPRFLPCRASV